MRTLRAPHNLKPITTLPAFAKATDGHSANVVMLTIPPRSDQSRSVCPHPLAFPFYFCLAGRFLNLGWARGLGQASLKKKRRNSNAKFKTLSRAKYTMFVFLWLCKVFRVHPRHPPRAFPLGYPRLKDECLTRIAIQKSKAKATH